MNNNIIYVRKTAAFLHLDGILINGVFKDVISKLRKTAAFLHLDGILINGVFKDVISKLHSCQTLKFTLYQYDMLNLILLPARTVLYAILLHEFDSKAESNCICDAKTIFATCNLV